MKTKNTRIAREIDLCYAHQSRDLGSHLTSADKWRDFDGRIVAGTMLDRSDCIELIKLEKEESRVVSAMMENGEN